MKGADVKCPMCGAGLADVAPDFDLAGGGADEFGSCTQMVCDVTCRGGHKLMTRWRAEPPEGEPEFEVKEWPSGVRERAGP